MTSPTSPSTPAQVVPAPIALVDLLDRLLATGVVVTGEVTLSIADVDLVYISLRAFLSSVGTIAQRPLDEEAEQ